MSIDQEIDSRKLALSGLNPQQLTDRLKRSGGLLDALATQKLISEKEAYKRDFAMQMEQSPKTIAQKNEDKIKQLSQIDVAQGVAGVLQNRKKRSDDNAKMLAGIDPRKLKAMTKRPMGLPSAPVPRVQKAAQGGIVGFQAGNEVIGLSGARNNNPFVRDISERDPTFRSLTQQFPNNPVLGEVPEMAEPGAIIAEAGSDIGNWVMSNPAEAIALGITSIPAVRGAKMAFNVSKSAFNMIKNIIAKNPKKILGTGAVGTFVGQDVVNPVLQNLPETMKSAGEKAIDIGKGITTLPKKAYEKGRNLLGIESPGLFTPDAAPASMPQVDTTTTDAAPTDNRMSLEEAQERFERIQAPEKRETKETRPTIPKVTGDESRSELNQKDEQLNSGLSRLASILSKYARSDPRKPGMFTAAVDEYDQDLLDEKRKVQAMRLKERELDISSRLADIRASGIQSTFLLNRLKELDRNILSARETVREGSEATLMGLKNQLNTLLQEKETFLGGLTSGFIGKSKEEIDAKIEEVKGAIKTEKGLMEIAVEEMAGDFIAERNQLNKYLKEYENYTGDDKKEDFNLKDQRTVGQ